MRQSMRFLLPQHVSGTNMPIVGSTISEYLPLLGGHTWKAARVVRTGLLGVNTARRMWPDLGTEQCLLQETERCKTQAAFQVRPPKSGSYLLIVLLMMGILVPETCWGNKTAYFVTSSWFFNFTMSTMHGHMNSKVQGLLLSLYPSSVSYTNVIVLMSMTAYLIQNNSRRRTPGGIFFYLLKRDDDIQQEKLNLIFTDDRKKTSTMKRHTLQHSRKARAEELRKSLSAGIFCLICLIM
jgi:hypothetical protein